MGISDLLIDGVLDNLFTSARRDRKLERLAQEGELVPATIYAIKVVAHSDTADDWYYGIDLVTCAGPLRASVKQHLVPDPWRATLGARVLARHLDGRVAIDWPATLAEAGVQSPTGLLAGKTLKKPLEPGIQDGHSNAKRLRDGMRCEAEVLANEMFELLGVPTQSRRLELRLDEPEGPRTVVLKSEAVPPYAAGLAEVGSRLPVAVDSKKPDRVTIDWPGAAEAAAGAAQPAAS